MSESWQMQEPVFRTSEGETVVPRAASEPEAVPPTPSNEEAAALAALYAPPEHVEAEAAATASAPALEPTPVVAAPVVNEAGGEINEQPYVSEEYDVEEIKTAVAAASPHKRSKGGLIFKLLAAVVVLGALAVAIIFLAWFFMMGPTE